MSGEQLTAKELNRKSEDLTFRKSSLRVDINDLTSRARQRNKKEKRENYICCAKYRKKKERIRIL